MFRHEDNVKGKMRLQACMLRKHREVYSDIAETIGYPLNTVKDIADKLTPTSVIIVISLIAVVIILFYTVKFYKHKQ